MRRRSVSVCVLFAFVFVAALAATAQPVIVGATSHLLGGMDYQNPSAGIFTRIHYAPRGRFALWETAEASNDRKVGLSGVNGWYFSSVTEVGFRATRRFTPEVVVHYGRQSNALYTKPTLSVGGGVRYALQPGLSLYWQYLAPDRLSFNHTQRIVGGMDIRLGRRWYVGIMQAIILFEQPGRGELVGMEVNGRVGFVLGGGER